MNQHPRKSASNARPFLSVAVITRDEEERLPRLLEHVWEYADEVVVVDSGSCDRTREIAEEAGARVFDLEWAGYGAQKQRALDRCLGEWVLSLDADEAPDPRQRRALRALRGAADIPVDAYALNRLTRYLGKELRYTWSPDWCVRLLRRGKGRWTTSPIHEKLVVDGAIGRLDGRLLHLGYRDLGEHYGKLVRYAELGAQAASERGRVFRAWQLVAHPLAAFVRRYVLHLGFLDGVRGLLASGAAASGTFMKYAFLYERGRRETARERGETKQ